ncbi:MAG TPA: glutamate-5-semialdehyde dehydrogenase [Firmicutes bacterium]|nr:glutamate-5-semialdehyde dehydrogenase [Bacillota bacterium]
MLITVTEQAKRAQAVTPALQACAAGKRSQILSDLGRTLLARQADIMAINLAEVKEQASLGLADALLDRLTLNAARIASMVEGVQQIAAAADIIGETIESWQRPNGLLVRKVRVPLGVIGVIYEARPNVTVDAAALCLKSGNAVLLRGSRMAARTNAYLVSIIAETLTRHGLPSDLVQMVQDGSHQSVLEMAQARGLLDLIVPRGGAELIRTVIESATVPVLETGVGNCHLYIDKSAPVEMALSLSLNGKCSRPGVCNAVETILLHQAWAEKHFLRLARELQVAGVALRLCPELQVRVPGSTLADTHDWSSEFLDLTVAIKQVASVDEAIAHIKRYGTRHSEAIVSLDDASVSRFFAGVDAACLYHNASTRFSDGYALGLGAEIGISTQKLHARGPTGILGLTTYKYLISGTGQTR